MGSVSIKSHLGDAQYSVDVQFDNASIEAKQTFIENRLIEIESQLTTLDSELTTKAGEIDAALAALNEYIETTPPQQIAADQSAINTLTKRCLELRADYDSLKRRQNWLKIEKTSLSKEADYLAKYCPSSIEINVWCIEYNEELEGASKSIEVDYAVIRDPLTDQISTEGIWLPGETEPATDILRHPMAGSVHSTWFDVAIAPGAQAHKGRYRVATIDAIDTDNDKADITLDGRYSPSESLTNVLDNDAMYPVIEGGQQMSVSGCPVVYMTCDAQAFEVGDKVIVDLHGGAGLPTVIGFYEKPKMCPWFKLVGSEDYPYFLNNGATTRFNLISETKDDKHPMLLEPELYTMQVDMGAKVAHTVVGSQTLWENSGFGEPIVCRLRFFNDDTASLQTTANATNSLTFTLSIYKNDVLVSAIEFSSNSQYPTLSPVPVTITHAGKKLFAAKKNGFESYFSIDA